MLSDWLQKASSDPDKAENKEAIVDFRYAIGAAMLAGLETVG